MARVRRAESRTNIHNVNRYGQMYVYGSAVAQPEMMPEEIQNPEPKQDLVASRQVRKNRRRAKNISPSYAVFLTGAAIFTVCVSILFLKLQSEAVTRSENVTALQQELVYLTEQNDTAYHAAEASVNLETVREKAVNELGMVYASQGSVVEYVGPENDSVTQYSDIPKDGVLAKTTGVSE